MFKFNRCDLYVLMYALYILQNVLYPQGIINQLLQLLMLLMALIESFNVFRTRVNSTILKTLLCLVIMYCIYGGWIILFGDNTNSYMYLQSSLKSILPIFMFCYYTKINFLNEKRIQIYSIVILLITIQSYYKIESTMQMQTEDDEFTNNSAYGFVNLIPMLYFYRKKPIIQYVLLGLLMTFILICMKRGAMLIGSVTMVLFLFSNFKGSSVKQKIIVAILSIVIIIFSVSFIKDFIQGSDYFVNRIEKTLDGDSSGRDVIYGTLMDAFLNETSITHFLFGQGANATVKIVGTFAHNDWLETLINNGLIGGIILLLFFISFMRTVYKQRKRFPAYMYYAFVSLFIIMFFKTLFSMSIQSIGIANAMLLGYLIYWSTRSEIEIVAIGND